MRLARRLSLALVSLAACTSQPGAEGEAGDTAAEQAGPDYAGCEFNGPYECRGTECAVDEDAVQWISLVEAEIAERGWSDRMWVVHGETLADTNEVRIELIMEVGWFRAWRPINGLSTEVNELEFRTDVGIFLDGFAPPTSVVEHQALLDAIADCHPDLDYDPCIHHGFGASIYLNVSYMPEPNCQEDLAVFSAELGTGEFVCDLDPPEVGCD